LSKKIKLGLQFSIVWNLNSNNLRLILSHFDEFGRNTKKNINTVFCAFIVFRKLCVDTDTFEIIFSES